MNTLYPYALYCAAAFAVLVAVSAIVLTILIKNAPTMDDMMDPPQEKPADPIDTGA